MKKVILRVIMIAGCLLVLLAGILFTVSQIKIKNNKERLQEYVAVINQALPERQEAVLSQKTDSGMPVISVDGNDFLGILSFTENNATFPVCAEWEDVDAFPCRYEGSLYDNSLIIGTTDQSGQLDFTDEIFVFDELVFTDMLGDCYSFKVADIRYVDSASDEELKKGDYPLTVFVKKMYSFKYIVINCVALGSEDMI